MKEQKDLVNMLIYETELYDKGIELIAGTDEVGRGPLVGPVVAAAVILPKGYNLEGLDDSKKLTEKKRDKYFDIIMKDAISVGLGIVDAKTIDEINILEASRLAMKLAIENLSVKPEHVLSDAMKLHNIQLSLYLHPLFSILQYLVYLKKHY